MIRGVHQIDLAVREANEVLPVVAAIRAEWEPNDRRWRAANIHLGVREGAQGSAPRVHEAGITHICLQSTDSAALYDRLAGQGIAFHAPLTTLGNGTYYAYGTLPSGATIEIETAVVPPGEPAAAWISHVALATPDLARLSDFYAELIGRPFAGGFRVPPSTANDVITGYPAVDLKVGWIGCGNMLIELWQYLDPPTRPAAEPREDGAPGYQALVFEVDDLDAEQPRLAALAGMTPVARGADGSARGWGRDPDGNAIGFVSFADAAGSIDGLDEPGRVPRLAAYRTTVPPPHYRRAMIW